MEPTTGKVTQKKNGVGVDWDEEGKAIEERQRKRMEEQRKKKRDPVDMYLMMGDTTTTK